MNRRPEKVLSSSKTLVSSAAEFAGIYRDERHYDVIEPVDSDWLIRDRLVAQQPLWHHSKLACFDWTGRTWCTQRPAGDIAIWHILSKKKIIRLKKLFLIGRETFHELNYPTTIWREISAPRHKTTHWLSTPIINHSAMKHSGLRPRGYGRTPPVVYSSTTPLALVLYCFIYT